MSEDPYLGPYVSDYTGEGTSAEIATLFPDMSEQEAIDFMLKSIAEAYGTTTPTTPTTSPPPPSPDTPTEVSDSDFLPAVREGIPHIQSLSGSAAKVFGQIVDSQPIINWGTEVAEKYDKEAKEVAKTYDKIDVHDLVEGGTEKDVIDFVQQSFGRILPFLLTSAVGSLGTGLIASSAGLTGLGLGTATLLGYGLPSFYLGTGEGQAELEQRTGQSDYKDPGTMVLTGAKIAALDMVGALFPLLKIYDKLGLRKVVADTMTKNGLPGASANQAAEAFIQIAKQQPKRFSSPEDVVKLYVQKISDQTTSSMRKNMSKHPSKLKGAARTMFITSAIEGGTEALQEHVLVTIGDEATGTELPADKYWKRLGAAGAEAFAGSLIPGAGVGALTSPSRTAKIGKEIEQERQLSEVDKESIEASKRARLDAGILTTEEEEVVTAARRINESPEPTELTTKEFTQEEIQEIEREHKTGYDNYRWKKDAAEKPEKYLSPFSRIANRLKVGTGLNHGLLKPIVNDRLTPVQSENILEGLSETVYVNKIKGKRNQKPQYTLTEEGIAFLTTPEPMLEKLEFSQKLIEEKIKTRDQELQDFDSFMVLRKNLSDLYQDPFSSFDSAIAGDPRAFEVNDSINKTQEQTEQIQERYKDNIIFNENGTEVLQFGTTKLSPVPVEERGGPSAVENIFNNPEVGITERAEFFGYKPRTNLQIQTEASMETIRQFPELLTQKNVNRTSSDIIYDYKDLNKNFEKLISNKNIKDKEGRPYIYGPMGSGALKFIQDYFTLSKEVAVLKKMLELPELQVSTQTPLAYTPAFRIRSAIQEKIRERESKLREMSIPFKSREFNNFIKNDPIKEHWLGDHLENLERIKKTPLQSEEGAALIREVQDGLQTTVLSNAELVEYESRDTGSLTPAEKSNVDSLSFINRLTKAPISGSGVQALYNRATLYTRWISSTRQMVYKHPELEGVYQAIKKYTEYSRIALNDGLSGSSLYYALNPNQRETVFKFEQAANLIGENISFPSRNTARLEVPENTYRGTAENPEPVVQYSDPFQMDKKYFITEEDIAKGLIETSDPAVVGALFQRAETKNSLWSFVIEADKLSILNEMVKVFNYENTEVASQVLEPYMEQAQQEPGIRSDNQQFIRGLKLFTENQDQTLVPEKQVDRVKNLVAVLQDHIYLQRKGYAPNIRKGDVSINIVRTTSTPVLDSKGQPTGKLKINKETIYRRDEVNPWFKSSDELKISWANKKFGNDLRRQIADPNNTAFNPATDKVVIRLRNEQDGAVSLDQLDKMGAAEAIFTMESMNVLGKDENQYKLKIFDEENNTIIETTPEDFIQIIGKRVRDRIRTQGFEKHFKARKGIPGYVNPENLEYYPNESWQNYVAGIARYFPRHMVQGEYQQAQNILNEGVKNHQIESNVRDLGARLWKETVTPVGMLSSIKTFGFYAFLGGNFSSAFLNLTQNFVTASILYGAYGKLYSPKVSRSALLASRLATEYIMGRPDGAILLQDQTVLEDIILRNRFVNTKNEATEVFNLLYQLQQEGYLGKINTEAMSQNQDMTGDYFSRKLGFSTFIESESFMGKQNRAFIRQSFGMLRRVIDSVYSYTEITNRIMSALATYGTIKKFGIEPLQNYTRVPEGMGREQEQFLNMEGKLDTENEFINIKNASKFIINASQFNLEAFNRPRISFVGRGLGSLSTQFLPFVTMLIEVYSNALGRYGGSTFRPVKAILTLGKEGSINPANMSKEGFRTLVYLVTGQVILSGLFGVPFADDINRLIKIFTKFASDSGILDVGELDIELMVKGYITETMGPEAYHYAHALNRGLPEFLGLGVGKRLAVAPFGRALEIWEGGTNPLQVIAGPSGTAFELIGERVLQSLKEGNYATALMRMIPIAGIQNIIKAMEASDQGVYTRAGNILHTGLDPIHLLFMGLGFRPEPIRYKQDQRYMKQYFNKRMKGVRESYADKLLKFKVQINKEGLPTEERQDLQDEMNKIYEKIYKHDINEPDSTRQIDPNFSLRKLVNTRYVKYITGRDVTLQKSKYWAIQNKIGTANESK